MLYLSRVRFENVRGFKELDLSFYEGTRRRAFTILIGNNGHGKTTVLRGIALGLCDEKTASELLSQLPGEFIRIKKVGNRPVGAASIIIELCGDQGESPVTLKTTISRDNQGELRVRKEIPDDFRWNQVFASGYGANRGTGGRSYSSYALRHSLLTLFNDRVGLLEPESVLRDFALASAERHGKAEDSPLERVRKVLWKVWDMNPNHKLDVKSDRIVVHGPVLGLPYTALPSDAEGLPKSSSRRARARRAERSK